MQTQALNLWAPASSLAFQSKMHRPDDRDCLVQHASCVSIHGNAALLFGPSGAGKSALALNLMALGAALVADDRTCLWRETDQIWADAPQVLRGKIEARYVGLLHAQAAGPSQVVIAIDLETTETDRFPAEKSLPLLGLSVPLLHNVHAQHFPAAILQYLKSGRWA